MVFIDQRQSFCLGIDKLKFVGHWVDYETQHA